MAKIPKYIAELISEGESQTLDFKFEISNAQKIAKTLVAFANSKGGILLVGVKDNGKIAGIRTDEEVFMIESAANIFSRPKIKYEVKSWNINGKQVLEIKINEGKLKPYYAKNYDNRWKSYIRVNDQNFLANRVLNRYWKEKNNRKVKIKYSREVEFLLDYLNDYNDITFTEFRKRADISKKRAENILVDLLILEIIKINISEKNTSYALIS